VKVIVRNERPREFCEDRKARKQEAGNEIEEYLGSVKGTK
jgi:hypothetical protein